MLQKIETPYKIVAITAATTFALCSLMELYRRQRTRKKDSRMTNVERSIDENVRMRRSRPKCWSELPEIALDKIFSQFTWKELIEIRKVCPRWKVFIEEHGFNTIEGKKRRFHFNWFYENPEVTTFSKHLDIQPEFISSKTYSAPVALLRDQQDGTQLRVIETAGNDWAVWPIDLGEDVGECAHVTDQLIIIGSCGEGLNDVFTLYAWDRCSHIRIWKCTYPRRQPQQDISGLFSACKSSILVLNENLFEVERFGRRNMTLTPTTVTYEMDFKFSSHFNTSDNLQFHDPYVLMYYYHEEVSYVDNDGVNVWDCPLEWIVLKVDDRTRSMSLVARIDDDLFLSRLSPSCFTADAAFSFPYLITAVDLEMVAVGVDPYSDEESELSTTEMSKLEVYDVVQRRSLHKEYRRGEHISLDYCDGKIVSVTGSINKNARVGKKELKVLDIQQILNTDKINYKNQIVSRNTQTLNLSGKEKVYNRKDFVNESSYFEIISGEKAKSVIITKLGWEGKINKEVK